MDMLCSGVLLKTSESPTGLYMILTTNGSARFVKH